MQISGTMNLPELAQQISGSPTEAAEMRKLLCEFFPGGDTDLIPPEEWSSLQKLSWARARSLEVDRAIAALDLRLGRVGR